MTNPINVGLVGFGLAGQVFHAPLIHANPNLRLTHILERRGNEAQNKYPQAKIVRDLDSLLRESSVELIVVATPNTSHLEIAAQSLQAGKHVVVDKPFTITSADAEQLIALSKKVGRVLSVFQNRRWDGDFLSVRQILEQKLLGRVAEFHSRFDRFRPGVRPEAWREQAGPGSGVLFDLGSHLIDQAVVLFGQPAGIYADLRMQRDGAVAVDNFEVQMEYPRLKVRLHAGSLVCEPSPRFLLYGTGGSYQKFGLDPQEDALKQGSIPGGPGWGEEPESAWGSLTHCDGEIARQKYRTLAGNYPGYYTNVCRAINGQEELAVKPEQSRNIIRLIELAEQSAREKCMVPCA
ncbi:MAG TPA: oxidoreductase [Terriglobales bacterium]|nr:oxidoreductase [Terriglobales bacterium]